MGALWQMPVEVACSLMATAGGIGFSCGQCPLDRAGRVVAPGDALAQAAQVAGLCEGVLALAPETPEAALLVIYHTSPDPRVLDPFRAAFPRAILAPVRLPHFYYPGMTIEVDIHAAATAAAPERLAEGEVTITRTAPGPLTRVHVAAEPGAAIGPALARAGLDPACLLAAHWFGPAAAIPAGWTTDPGAVVLPAAPGPVTGILTLAPEPVTIRLLPGGARLRRQGDFLALSAHSAAPDLAAAATKVMDRIAEAGPLVMLKTTTHYVGGPTPEDLHANLAVRHARFPRPGPASTGVPVAGLSGGTLALDLVAWVDSGAAAA